MLSRNKYMPDVLDCLANLSSDEVFTPPEIANKILDMLPQDVFESKETTFLDPCTKSGVFLREITKRLLKHQIPNYEEMASEIDMIEKAAIQEAVRTDLLKLTDAEYGEKAKKIGRDAVLIHPRASKFLKFEQKLQEELNRIFTTQVFGIAITELTGHLARRSLYCSKDAGGEYSICTSFGKDGSGNIRFAPMKHSWKNGSCVYCGASASTLDRPDDYESHAYEFIHKNIEEIRREYNNMEFTVVCGNPPYQLNTEDNIQAAQAVPLYHKFVEQAKRLNPKYLTMIIPARWFSGGIGLQDFRQTMMRDEHISHLTFYPKSRECFSGVDIAGGVMYFLRDTSYNGLCSFTTVHGSDSYTLQRKLSENNIIIGENEAVAVIRKVQKATKQYMSSVVYPMDIFSLKSSTRGNATKEKDNDLLIVTSKGNGYIDNAMVKKNRALLDKYKVIIGQLNPDRGGVNNSKDGMYGVITKARILAPQEVMTSSYLTVYTCDNADIANNVQAYLSTKFVRFLIFATLSSMHITRDSFQFVPVIDFSKQWTDKELYEKYKITDNEVAFIDSIIKPMELGESK